MKERMSQRAAKSRTSAYDDDEEDAEAKMKELAARLSSANQRGGGGEWWTQMVEPDAFMYRCWLGFVCALSFYSACEALFTIAFLDVYARYWSMMPLAYLIDIVFMVHVGVQFRTGYFDKTTGEKVMDKDLVVRHYGRSVRGVIEILAVLPIDLVQIGTGWTPLVRLTKILRMYSMPKQLRTISETSVAPRTINLITIVRMLLLWVVASHSAACIRVLFAAVEGYGGEGHEKELYGFPDREDTWNLDARLEEKQPFTIYLNSL